MAIAFAREGADVLIAYLDEHDDAQETARLGRAGRPKAVLVPGDVAERAHCRPSSTPPSKEFGRIDVLVNNAAYQMTHEELEEITDEEWDRTFDANICAMFHLTKAAVPHMRPARRSSAPRRSTPTRPSPTLLPYAATKAAIANFGRGLAQLLGRARHPRQQRRARADLDAADPLDHAGGEGRELRFRRRRSGRPGQPAELAPVYVLLASDEASYISGARIAVTGGKPIL